MQRLAIGVLAAGSAVLLVSVVVGGPPAEIAFVVASLAFPGALILLAGRPRRRPWRILVPVGVTALLEGAAAVVLFGGGSWPVLAMIVGLCLLPLAVVPWLHAVTERAAR